MKYLLDEDYEDDLIACYRSYVRVLKGDGIHFGERLRFDFREVMNNAKDEHITDGLFFETETKCIVATSLQNYHI